MKMEINRVKHALTTVWCAGVLLLGGCSGTGEGTWKQEYENCMAAMEQSISELSMAGGQDLFDYEKRGRDWYIELRQDSLSAFNECMETCIRNQPGGMDGEEDIYRNATLLMAAMCEEHNASYEFVYGHGEDMGKAREDFKAVIEGENPIDKSMNSLREDFGIYYYADTFISEMTSKAWQEEFYHCLDVAGNEVKQSDAADKEQFLEILEVWEDFFEVWTDNEAKCIRQEFHYEESSGNEELYEWIRSGGGLSIWQAESRAEVFRIGTLLLIDGLEKSGVSYGFIYDSEADRQELPDLLGIRPGTEEGTWKQEYEVCMAAMELGISRYDVTGADIPYENLPDFEKWVSDRSMELWRDSLRIFDECMTVCISNQPGGKDGEEDTYRMAALLMKVMCESRNGHYKFAHGHGEDLEKAQEDFKAVIERENPIDESWDSFNKEFESYVGVDFTISAMMSEAWQGEFYHCLNTVRDRVKQSGTADQEQILEALEAWKDFFKVWADNEEEYERIEGGSGLSISIAESRAEVFRIGTMLLIDSLEKSGVSYEYTYDSGPDRKELTEWFCE